MSEVTARGDVLKSILEVVAASKSGSRKILVNGAWVIDAEALLAQMSSGVVDVDPLDWEHLCEDIYGGAFDPPSSDFEEEK